MIYYYINDHRLPDYLTIEIVKENDSKHIYFLSDIHEIKRCKHSISFSAEYADHEILMDSKLYSTLCAKYGLSLVTKLQ